MADHSARPDKAASPSLAVLHAACREDYTSNAAQRITQDHRDDVHLIPDTAPAATPTTRTSELRTAILIAQKMLAKYGNSHDGDAFAYPEAYGALAETLRILLRALGAEPGERPIARCPAAHPDDPTPCVGPAVVTVMDATNAGAEGCEHHAARLLASLDGGRVYPLPTAPEGSAIRVFKAADGTRPFPWMTTAPRNQSSQLSHAENRARGEYR